MFRPTLPSLVLGAARRIAERWVIRGSRLLGTHLSGARGIPNSVDRRTRAKAAPLQALGRSRAIPACKT
jgi:hypothetical protein